MQHFRLTSSTRWFVTPQGGNLLDKSSGACFEVNSVGRMIIVGILGGKMLKDIAADIGSLFEMKEEHVYCDAQTFTDNLLSIGLIELEHGNS